MVFLMEWINKINHFATMKKTFSEKTQKNSNDEEMERMKTIFQKKNIIRKGKDLTEV